MPNFFSIRRDRTHFFDFGFCAFEILDKMCFWDFKLFGLRIFVSNRKQISRDDGDPWLTLRTFQGNLNINWFGHWLVNKFSILWYVGIKVSIQPEIIAFPLCWNGIWLASWHVAKIGKRANRKKTQPKRLLTLIRQREKDSKEKLQE